MRRAPAPEFRQHRTLIGGEMEPGATIAQDSVVREAIPFTSAQNGRIRFKSSVAGTLSAAWMRPGLQQRNAASFDDDDDLSTAAVGITGNPTDVAIAADTEGMMDVSCAGEAWLLLSFTEPDVGAGTVTYCNVAQL